MKEGAPRQEKEKEAPDYFAKLREAVAGIIALTGAMSGTAEASATTPETHSAFENVRLSVLRVLEKINDPDFTSRAQDDMSRLSGMSTPLPSGASYKLLVLDAHIGENGAHAKGSRGTLLNPSLRVANVRFNAHSDSFSETQIPQSVSHDAQAPVEIFSGFTEAFSITPLAEAAVHSTERIDAFGNGETVEEAVMDALKKVSPETKHTTEPSHQGVPARYGEYTSIDFEQVVKQLSIGVRDDLYSAEAGYTVDVSVELGEFVAEKK